MTIITDDVTPQLAAMRERLGHPAPVLEGPVADGVREVFKKQFESQGTYGGEPWDQLSAETTMKGGVWGDVLVRDGTLEASLTVKGASYSHASMLNEHTLAVGSDAPGGFFAEMGTLHEPRRPIIPDVAQADRDHWAELVTDWITEGRL